MYFLTANWALTGEEATNTWKLHIVPTFSLLVSSWWSLAWSITYKWSTGLPHLAV